MLQYKTKEDYWYHYVIHKLMCVLQTRKFNAGFKCSLLNLIMLQKNQNGFRLNRSTVGKILNIRCLIEGIKSRNLEAVIIFVDFSKAFDSIHKRQTERNPPSLWFTTRNCFSYYDAIQRH